MSKLTLDEAIKHCEEVAEKNETSAIVYKNCKEIKSTIVFGFWYMLLTEDGEEQ